MNRPRSVIGSLIAAMALILVFVAIAFWSLDFFLQLGAVGYFGVLALGAALFLLAVYLVATAGREPKE